MADIKIYTNDELKKMSKKDLLRVAREMEAHIQHETLMLVSNEHKQSHKAALYRKLRARALTFSNQKSSDEN